MIKMAGGQYSRFLCFFLEVVYKTFNPTIKIISLRKIADTHKCLNAEWFNTNVIDGKTSVAGVSTMHFVRSFTFTSYKNTFLTIATARIGSSYV